MKKLQKGFTLIELLVVVAIIGILATVVLASLGQARSRAKNAAAQAALSQLRAEMELMAPDNGANGYTTGTGNACIAAADKFRTAANTQTGNVTECNATATAYAASIQLIGTPTQRFCVDSTGYAGPRGNALGTDTKCL